MLCKCKTEKRRYHPAVVRPGMYSGEQGARSERQWLIDALVAYGEPDAQSE